MRSLVCAACALLLFVSASALLSSRDHTPVAPAGYRFFQSAGAISARNPAQRLNLAFATSGVTAVGDGMTVGMSVRSIDYGRGARGVPHVHPALRSGLVEYRRRGLSEWYANGPAGLEQGFTVTGATGGGSSITIALSLSGNARAALSPDASRLTLSAPGRPSLRYGGLSAVDSRGRALPAVIALHGRTLLLRVDTSGAHYPLRIDPTLSASPTLASPAGEGGRFGNDIALSGKGTTAIVGAPLDGSGGTAWIYVRSGPDWTRQGPPLAGLETPEPCVPEGEPELCRFGVSVAISGDGNTVLIGAPAERGGEGGARIYTRAHGAWTPGPRLRAAVQTPTGHFGRSVALSEDGETALVGEPFEEHGHGAAWVFHRSGASWTAISELRGAGEQGAAYFGRTVALSADGSTALVTGPEDNGGIGAAWPYTLTGGQWSQQGATLTSAEPSGAERFGRSAAMSRDGSTILLGAPNYAGNVGAAYVFTRSASIWSQQGAPLRPATPQGASRLGNNVALSGDGDLALAGGANDSIGDGAIWEFAREGGSWSEKAETLVGSEGRDHAHLGASVAISADATTALAGGPYFENETGGVWSLFETPFPTPAVTGVEPASGPTEGGTRVTITGSGFLPDAAVDIGGAAGDVEVLSETEIKATTAAAPAGADEVVVEDAGGTSSAGPSFTFVAPKKEEPAEEEKPKKEEPKKEEPKTEETHNAQSGTLGVIETNVLPAPEAGKTGNLAPVSGQVLIELPGSLKFVAVTGLTQVPFGTIIDATNGKVTITTVGPDGKLQQVTFYGGAFELLQQKNRQVLAVLAGGSFTGCPTARERAHRASTTATTAKSRKRVVRKLWASGHGSYTTKGNYAAGAVVGTIWLTEDKCDGTLIYVATDRVLVTNLVTHKRRMVRAHHRYFAAAP